MIIIHLTGGLGNQLFQYAFARSLSYNLDTELFLDTSRFSHSEKRKHAVFGLHSFNIKGMIGYYPYIEKTFAGITDNKSHKLSKYVEGSPFPENIHNYEIIEKIDVNLPTYFQGWYQIQIDNGKNSFITENFFKANNKLIHGDLKYSLPLSHNSKSLFEDMKQYDSIALHIRHGDYEKYPKFGFCTTEYYQNAISLLTQRLDNPKFYIFTEDPDWVESNLKINFPFDIIRFNEKNNTVARGYGELLKLMSLCNHFILANSTFSWWAAFLSENKNKIIISPKPWFQDRHIIETDTIDNVKTINLKNDYLAMFERSDKVLYSMENNQKCNSDFYLRCKIPKNSNAKAIIKFSIESNCLNGLRIYYKTTNKNKFTEKNSLNLYYYIDEKVNHCLILPKEAVLDEIKIKPYILKRNIGNYMKINSITVKELNDY